MYNTFYVPQGNNTYGFCVMEKINRERQLPINCFHVSQNEDGKVFLTPLSEDTEKIFSRFAKTYRDLLKAGKKISNPSMYAYPLKKVGDSYELMDPSQKCFFFAYTSITELEVLHLHYENFLATFVGKINASARSVKIEDFVVQAFNRVIQSFEEKRIYAAHVDYEDRTIFWRVDPSCPLESVKDILNHLDHTVIYYFANSILYVPLAKTNDDSALDTKNILASGYPYFVVEFSYASLMGGGLENLI